MFGILLQMEAVWWQANVSQQANISAMKEGRELVIRAGFYLPFLLKSKQETLWEQSVSVLQVLVKQTEKEGEFSEYERQQPATSHPRLNKYRSLSCSSPALFFRTYNSFGCPSLDLLLPLLGQLCAHTGSHSAGNQQPHQQPNHCRNRAGLTEINLQWLEPSTTHLTTALKHPWHPQQGIMG